MSRGALPTTPMPITTDSNERLRMMAFALGGALRGDPNFAQQTLALRKQQQQQLQQQQRQTKLQELAQTDPNLARMYELFGERGLQQGYLQQQEQQQKLLQSQEQIQRLANAGFSNEEINLALAGVDLEDILELRKEGLSGVEEKTTEQLVQEVEEQKLQDPESLKKLENIGQAFGAVDAVEQKLNVALGPIFGTPFKGTAEAVSAKNVLNERIREKFVNQYSGRPSVYINQRIDLLLPRGEYIDEAIAASKYQDTRKVLREGLDEMKTKIDSGIYKGTELLEVQQNFKDIQSIVSDLDVAIKALEGTKKDPEILSPSTIFKPSGAYDSFYTANTK